MKNKLMKQIAIIVCFTIGFLIGFAVCDLIQEANIKKIEKEKSETEVLSLSFDNKQQDTYCGLPWRQKDRDRMLCDEYYHKLYEEARSNTKHFERMIDLSMKEYVDVSFAEQGFNKSLHEELYYESRWNGFTREQTAKRGIVCEYCD